MRCRFDPDGELYPLSKENKLTIEEFNPRIGLCECRSQLAGFTLVLENFFTKLVSIMTHFFSVCLEVSSDFLKLPSLIQLAREQTPVETMDSLVPIYKARPNEVLIQHPQPERTILEIDKRRMAGEAAFINQLNAQKEQERRDKEKQRLREQLPYIWLGSQDTSYSDQPTGGPTGDEEVDKRGHEPPRFVEGQGSSSKLRTERTGGGHVPARPRGHREHKERKESTGGKRGSVHKGSK
ncbi:hypothetical protein ACEPAG_4327 [Sanghuangporus baumii]